MENIVGQPQTVQVPNYSGVNIQIFNPSVAAPGSTVPPATVNTTCATNPCYPPNYYTQNFTQPAPATPTAPASTLQPVQALQPAQYSQNTNRKTEMREIVELTDEYVKSLESYLNNQDKQIRLIGAKEVLARLQEDDSRKNDEALNALLNKMLQDPYQPIKFIAMAAFESRTATGNDKSVELLQNIQGQGVAGQKTVQSEDSLKASNALLKMTATTTKKEFEVRERPARAESHKKEHNEVK